MCWSRSRVYSAEAKTPYTSDLYQTGVKQDSDGLCLVGTRSGADLDLKFAKQDWDLDSKNQSPNTSTAHQENRSLVLKNVRITGIRTNT